VAAQAGPTTIETLTALGIELSHDGQHRRPSSCSIEWWPAPRAGSAHANLGMALLAANQLEESVSASLRALELDGGSGQAYCGLGLAYQRLEAPRGGGARPSPPASS
jgi:hypothetical protein